MPFNHEEAFSGKYELFRDTWLNNGFNAVTQQRITYQDVLATPQAQAWMPKVVSEVVREPIEPNLIITSLLDRVQHSGPRISFPALGALVAYDVGEAQAFPEQYLQIAPGSITVNIGKSGLAVSLTDEMLRYSQFDLINMHIRACRRALDRHKEKKGFDFITSLGVSLFDNKNPTTSVYGTCTGRNAVGSGNGSCRVEDLVKAFAHIMLQGFIPDTILLHPLTWSMWMADPVMQTIVKNTGQGSWYESVDRPRAVTDWSNANQASQGVSAGRSYTPSGNAASATPTSVAGVDQNMGSAPQAPSRFPWGLRVLVSPFMPFNTHNNTADILIFDSGNLGALVVDEDVVSDRWEDMSTDVMKIKLKERYGFAIYEDGLAVGVMKNIPVVANEIAFPVQPTISSAGSLAALDTTTAISGL